MLIKRIKKVAVFCVLMVMALSEVKAQDFIFSQFYANPLYLNPALAGAAICPRINFAFRDQWPAASGTFINFSASYDQHIDALSGGIGAFVAADKHGAFTTVMGSLMYAYQFKITRQLYARAALKASFISNQLNFNDLTFGDMIDPQYGFIHGTQAEAPNSDNKIYPDFGVGAVIYGKNFYGGLAFDHLTQPSEGFYGVSKLPMKITVHAGALFNVQADRRRTSPLGLKSPIISPNIIFQHMQTFNYMNYGLYLDWLPIVLGAWFRHGFENPDAVIFLVGFQQSSYKIGYSYDLTVSKLSNSNTGGSHEITFSYLFPCHEKEQKRKHSELQCPSF